MMKNCLVRSPLGLGTAMGAALLLSTSMSNAQARKIESKVVTGPTFAEVLAKSNAPRVKVKKLKKVGEGFAEAIGPESLQLIENAWFDAPLMGPAPAKANVAMGMRSGASSSQGGIAGPPAACGTGGSCFVGQATPGCNDVDCCTAVCACDPFCCSNSWDVYCAGAGYVPGCGAALLCSPSVPNNLCANAESVGYGAFPFNTGGATTDGLDMGAGCLASGDTNMFNDVWFNFTAPATESVRLSTCIGTLGDTEIAVYDGCGCPTGAAPIACNDDACALQSRLDFNATAGNCYKIRLGNFATDGAANGSLAIGTTPAAPLASYSNLTSLGQVGTQNTLLRADNLVHKHPGEWTRVTFSIGNVNTATSTTSTLQTVSLSLVFWDNPPGNGAILNPDTIFLIIDIEDAAVNVGQNAFGLFEVDFTKDIDPPLPPETTSLSRPLVWAGIGFVEGTFASTGDLSNVGQLLVNPPTIGQSPTSLWVEGLGFAAFGSGANLAWELGVNEIVDPCEITVPSGATIEAEACGAAANNGCNATPNVFELVTSNSVIHGTARANGGTRDTDWYELVIPSDVPGGVAEVTLTLHSEVTSVLFRMDAACPAGILDNVIAGHGQPGSVSIFLLPGVHHIFVAAGTPNGAIFEGYPCGTQSDYILQIDCGGGTVAVDCGEKKQPNPCPPDLAPPGGDGTVNVDDLVILLGSWGPCVACQQDLAPPGGDGQVNVDDLVILLGSWGPCVQ